jgi:hypothetical protein
MMRVRRLRGIEDVDKEMWRALEPPEFPFFDFEFLHALEHSGSIGRRSGWTPAYLVCKLGVGAGIPAVRALILPQAGSRRAVHTRDRAQAPPAPRFRWHDPCQGDKGFARGGGGAWNRVPGELLARALLARA